MFNRKQDTSKIQSGNEIVPEKKTYRNKTSQEQFKEFKEETDTEELSPEEKAKKDNRTSSNKIKDAYTPTPLGGLITMILSLFGLLQIYLMGSGGYGYYWNMVKNLPSNIWNEIVTFFSKLF